jgi:hypothetical protein
LTNRIRIVLPKYARIASALTAHLVGILIWSAAHILAFVLLFPFKCCWIAVGILQSKKPGASFDPKCAIAATAKKKPAARRALAICVAVALIDLIFSVEKFWRWVASGMLQSESVPLDGCSSGSKAVGASIGKISVKGAAVVRNGDHTASETSPVAGQQSKHAIGERVGNSLPADRLAFVAQSCSWCHELNEIGPELSAFCWACGHRADVARALCTCQVCFQPVEDCA